MGWCVTCATDTQSLPFLGPHLDVGWRNVLLTLTCLDCNLLSKTNIFIKFLVNLQSVYSPTPPSTKRKVLYCSILTLFGLHIHLEGMKKQPQMRLEYLTRKQFFLFLVMGLVLKHCTQYILTILNLMKRVHLHYRTASSSFAPSLKKKQFFVRTGWEMFSHARQFFIKLANM